jgi:hypothetical protein
MPVKRCAEVAREEGAAHLIEALAQDIRVAVEAPRPAEEIFSGEIASWRRAMVM